MKHDEFWKNLVNRVLRYSGVISDTLLFPSYTHTASKSLRNKRRQRDTTQTYEWYDVASVGKYPLLRADNSDVRQVPANRMKHVLIRLTASENIRRAQFALAKEFYITGIYTGLIGISISRYIDGYYTRSRLAGYRQLIFTLSTTLSHLRART